MSVIGSAGSGLVSFWNANEIGASNERTRDVFGRIQKEIDEKQAKNGPAKIAEQQQVTGQPIVLQSGTANTLWEAQSYAQSEESQAADAEEVAHEELSSLPSKPSAEEEFMEYMNRPTEDLLREAIMKELGYTEEDLENLDPKDRAKVEAKIKELLEQKIEESMKEDGYSIDISSAQSPNPIPGGAFEIFN